MLQKGNLQSHLKPQRLNTILKGHIKSNSPNKLLPLFQRSRRRGGASAFVDSFSLLYVLKACTMRSCEVEGKQIHGLVITMGFPSVIFLQSSMINMYSALGSVKDAHGVFDEIPVRNIVCWTALISAYIDNGKPSKALELFRQMQTENVNPDQVTVTVALSACADLGELDMGEWIHAYVRRKQGFETDVCLNNALINMYVKCGDTGTARRMFDGLTRRDVTTWTSMIVGHALNGEAEDALKLFIEMENKNENVGKRNNAASHNDLILPNEITFLGVIMACSHAGLVEEGWKHFRSMSKKYGLRPQISHYGCMVDLLCRAGLLEEVHTFITNMSMRANAVVWRTLLGACRLQGNIELGAKARRRLLELDPTYVGDDVTISNTYASAGMWDEKEMVRAHIKHRRPPGCSSIQLADGVHEFIAADNNHPLKAMIYEVLEAMIKNMTASGYVPDIFSAADNCGTDK